MDNIEAKKDSAPESGLVHGSAKSYSIRTLQDIWNLPSYEHMERCFYDTQRAMLQARATNDMFIGLAQCDGKNVTKAFMWPETMQWIDDGKNEIHATYSGPDWKPFLTMNTTKDHSLQNNQASATPKHGHV